MMDEKTLTTQREEFQTGESLIVLYQGKYNGMAGKFVGIRPDPDWADIEVAPGIVRAHPVDWLRKIDGRANAVSKDDAMVSSPHSSDRDTTVSGKQHT